MLTPLDYAVIAIYLVLVVTLGIRAGGKQRHAEDYFIGSRTLPWWAVCFSIVATETSTLTVLSVPAVAYLGTMTFFQLTLGYLLGRIIVSLLFLPRYFEGKMMTAYTYLGSRFGDKMRMTASVTFLITRLLADGVRLFATAIPIKVIAVSVGISVSYFQIILLIALATILYTLVGGIKAVVWMDVVQLGVYLGGGILSVILLLVDMPATGWTQVLETGKLQLFDWGLPFSAVGWLTEPYVFVTAVVGGAFFSMASHGADHIIVQRLLTCRSLRDSQKALIGSGVVVMVQMALFLFLGLLLWVHYNGTTVEALGLSRGDEVYPKFIIEGLPPGVSGLMLSGILAAAMSTLSSSLNALASSSLVDVLLRKSTAMLSEGKSLRLSRYLTLFWGVVFAGFASLFTNTENPVVELGLSIATFTYGGLLGVFLLGLLHPRANQRDALISFVVTILLMVFLIFAVRYNGDLGWVVTWGMSPEMLASTPLKSIGWPWYTAIGSLITLATGSMLALWHWTKNTP